MEKLGIFKENISWTLLMRAIERSLSLDCIKEIVNQGANVNAGSLKTGMTYSYYPIILAVCNNNLELVKFLVEKGASLNVIGGCNGSSGTPLQVAINEKYKNIAAYLYSKGAN